MPHDVPRVGALPLLGSLPRFLLDPFGTLEAAAEVGDVSLLRLGFVDAVTLHHPAHADHVLRKHQRQYPKGGPYWEGIRGLLGNGLPTSEGELWLRQRRMMQPQFHRKRLQALTSLVVDALDRSLQWHDVGDQWQVIDVGARIPHLTMNVVSAAMFGRRTSQSRSHTIGEALDCALDQIFRGMVAQALPRWVPIPGRRRFSRAAAQLQRILGEVIEERRRDSSNGDDLLALMLAAIDEDTGEGMTSAQLLDEVMSLFLAGYETTANGLQWALYYLCEHPQHLHRLREQSDAVLRGGLPDFDALRRLSYARQVMQEALRLQPPAWWLPRIASEDDEIGGRRIPAGTMVAPVIYTIHRHPALWSRPECFDPERFDPTEVAHRHPLAWMPFGAGPRQCIGQELSLMESTMALAIISQRYELESVGHRTRPRLTTVIVPDNGVRLRIRARPRAGADRSRDASTSASDSSSTMSI